VLEEGCTRIPRSRLFKHGEKFRCGVPCRLNHNLFYLVAKVNLLPAVCNSHDSSIDALTLVGQLEFPLILERCITSYCCSTLISCAFVPLCLSRGLGVVKASRQCTYSVTLHPTGTCLPCAPNSFKSKSSLQTSWSSRSLLIWCATDRPQTLA
jgi:hypothetical protein